MVMITSVTLGVADTAAAESFYTTFGVRDHVGVSATDDAGDLGAFTGPYGFVRERAAGDRVG